MELELAHLELTYEKLRRRDERKERQLISSLADHGQLLPVLVVRHERLSSFVLVDGYKRVRALRRLRRDTVCATPWELGELEAVLLERLMRAGEADGALEQGWLLEELNERFDLSHEELARRFDKSQSWVSRRLALVRALPREVQERVQSGALPAHAAMKYLVPMARAKRTDCVRLVEALTPLRPSSRQVAALYAMWVAGNAETRELVVTNPAVALRARDLVGVEAPLAEKTPGQKLVDDFGILIGTSRRARTRLTPGILGQMLSSEIAQARRSAQQARFECEALFDAAASWLSEPCTTTLTAESTTGAAALPPATEPPQTEFDHAR
jgi:ParB/RepB/Spo0J family partition protein